MALPSWVPDDETKPAPMPLLVVQSFVNTWEGDSGTDVLADPASAARWLRDAGLLDERPRSRARTLPSCGRRGRRSAPCSSTTPGAWRRTGATILALGALAQGCRLQPVVLADGGVDLRPGDGTGAGGLATLLLIIRDAQRDGTWSRLKACRNPDCRWAYYDRSHAGRGAWCDMAVCGNRIKNRNLRSRRTGRGRTTEAEVSG